MLAVRLFLVYEDLFRFKREVVQLIDELALLLAPRVQRPQLRPEDFATESCVFVVIKTELLQLDMLEGAPAEAVSDMLSPEGRVDELGDLWDDVVILQPALAGLERQA